MVALVAARAPGSAGGDRSARRLPTARSWRWKTATTPSSRRCLRPVHPWMRPMIKVARRSRTPSPLVMMGWWRPCSNHGRVRPLSGDCAIDGSRALACIPSVLVVVCGVTRREKLGLLWECGGRRTMEPSFLHHRRPRRQGDIGAYGGETCLPLAKQRTYHRKEWLPRVVRPRPPRLSYCLCLTEVFPPITDTSFRSGAKPGTRGGVSPRAAAVAATAHDGPAVIASDILPVTHRWRRGRVSCDPG